MNIYSSTSDALSGKLIDEEGHQFHVSADTCTCKPVVKKISSQDHTPYQWVFGTNFHWHHLLRNRCVKPSVVAMQKTVPLCCDLYQMHHVCTCRLTTGDSVLVLIVDEIFFAISLVFWSNHQHLTHPKPCIPLCVCHASKNSPNLPPILNRLPLTYNWVQCAYPQTTRSSAALESSRPSESWMWLGTKGVALKICSIYSELKELTQNFIFSIIREFMVSQKLIQCSKSKI